MEGRDDVAKLESSRQEALMGRGMQITPVDRVSFRDALRSAAFYKEWREKFGESAWKVLEKYTGELA